MTRNPGNNSSAWKTFTHISFGVSLVLMMGGIIYVDIDMATKGYLTMGTFMLIQSCITLTKTIRDEHESDRLVNRIEEAKTERILRGFDQAAE